VLPDQDGVEENARLTAATAVVLLGLLATEGVTIVFLRPLLSVHVFVGMMLIPPVALKLGATGWRFARYYLGDAAYRLKGPPHPFMRLLVAPGVVLTTVFVLGTGVALLVMGPSGGVVRGLHKASFVLWFGAMGLHVLGHVLKLPGLVAADVRRRTRLPSARARALLLLGSLMAGAVLAASTLHLAQPWLHWRHFR
jgi:hypothetical protein